MRGDQERAKYIGQEGYGTFGKLIGRAVPQREFAGGCEGNRVCVFDLLFSANLWRTKQ